MRAASRMCDARDAPAEAVRVAPRRGMAVLFLSAAPHGGAPLPHMWHGGCRVRRGEKWTLQRFKELPQGHPSGGVFSQRWSGTSPPESLLFSVVSQVYCTRDCECG